VRLSTLFADNLSHDQVLYGNVAFFHTSGDFAISSLIYKQSKGAKTQENAEKALEWPEHSVRPVGRSQSSYIDKYISVYFKFAVMRPNSSIIKQCSNSTQDIKTP